VGTCFMTDRSVKDKRCEGEFPNIFAIIFSLAVTFL